MPQWLPPAVGFLLVLGTQAIVIKLALRHVQWPTILGWTTIVYMLVLGILMVRGRIRVEFLGTIAGTVLAVLSGVGAASGFILLNIALSRGKATQVVPVTSAYPIITTFLAVLILGESLTRSRMLGIALVVLGLFVLGAGSD